MMRHLEARRWAGRHDYGIPDARKRPGTGDPLEKDFADDDFWNRTDEQDTASPKPAWRPNADAADQATDEETPLPALSREELADLHDEAGP